MHTPTGQEMTSEPRTVLYYLTFPLQKINQPVWHPVLVGIFAQLGFLRTGQSSPSWPVCMAGATYAESLALFVRGRLLGRSGLLVRRRGRHVEELLPALDGGRLLGVVGLAGSRAVAQVGVRRHIAVGGLGGCRRRLCLLQVVQLEVVFELGERDDLAALLNGAFGVLYTFRAPRRLGLDWPRRTSLLD